MPEPRSGTAHLAAADAARLRSAEDRLYPLALLDAERYQRGTALCALLLEDLRTHASDTPAVLGRRDELLDLLPHLAEQTGLGLSGLERETLVDAASALRCRELEAAQAHGREQERLAAAREAGEEWLVDEPDPAAVLAGAFRRVELHVRTGTRLVSRVEAGTAGRPTTYHLDLVPADPGDTPPRSMQLDDQRAWLRACEQCRAEISAQP
jgi:hypothetical protein